MTDHFEPLQTEPDYLRQHLFSVSKAKSLRSTKCADLRSRIAWWELSYEFDNHEFWYGALLELEHL